MTNYWYRVTIQIPKDIKLYKTFKLGQIDSIIHYILAAEVFSKYINKVELWRFSRYSYNFDDVIIMKFKFYCEKVIFDRIKPKILDDAIVKKLEKEGLIKIGIEKATESNKKIGSDRDDNWPYLISESWPYFINGLSRMWLRMILVEKEKYLRENYINNNIREMDLFKLFTVYKVIKENVVDNWIKWGSHAICHHANALFGYHPIRFNVTESDLYYEKGKDIGRNKRDEAWYKRFDRYMIYVKILIFKYKLKVFKSKNKMGYINL